ncbi:non-ribosomal peptide synthetase [Paracandidimonas soli]|uniref:Enterobactin synthetase component F n=2 Tax=Paracandidimonas soli TaxID=1917182 RepID=A0A4R3V131_9BURK|nr:non-ribosomal peptide synthetase [Paracandidimonas soli]TCU97131.1 enterobactin synthetase component F [Paracandidimonas soli]
MRLEDGCVLPLTDAQAGLWFAQKLDPVNPVFNTGQYTEIRGGLDVDAFRRAVDETMAESQMLAVRVFERDSVPHLQYDSRLCPRLQVVDLRASEDPVGEAQARMRADLAQPAGLEQGLGVQEILYVLGDAHYYWFQRIHHIAIDSYGMSLIDGRVAQRYRQILEGSQDSHGALAPLRLLMDDEQAYAESERMARDREYWMEAFSGIEAVHSLSDGVALTAHEFHQQSVSLGDEASGLLRQREASSGVSWPDILLLLCAAYVGRLTGQEGAVLGVPYMGRMGSAAARTPSMMMNIMPVHLPVDETAALDDVLVQSARLLRKARRHGRYRGERLRRDLGLLGGNRRLHGPLVNILPFLSDESVFPGAKARTHVMCAGPVDDMTFTFRADAAGNGLLLIVEANPALYSEEDVAAHMRRLQAFLPAALAGNSLRHVPTLTPQEHEHWVHAVNDTAADVPRTTLVALIDKMMKARPEAVALEFGNQVLSYAELDRRVDALTALLQGRGVGRGDFVAVAIPRSVELIVALLGIQRAGAAYLPLDTGNPASRLAVILSSAEPRAVLAVGETLGCLPEFHTVLCLDEPDLEAEAASQAPFADAGVQPEDPAYLLYTSGSTGTPKGVVIEHDAIVNRLEWMRRHYGIGPGDRILQKTPATFDVSVWEFFLPFLSGATLVVAPPEAHRDPAWLARILCESRITTLHFVPSMLAAFLEEPTAANARPARVFCSGEELTPALRDRFHQILDAELHNLYGPTEAAVDVTYWPASRTDQSQPVPIGFPVWNTRMYVLDKYLRPVPAGIPGNLYIAGRQLARGYLGRPDLTRQRFVPDPFVGGGARMYDTGDIARWRADGALEYMGRSDHQVKIRGQRVELGEIEAALAAAPGVGRLAVLVREDRPGDQQVVAYVVPAAGAGLDHEVLRNHMAARLPDYMTPSAFVELPALPVTANGKLDRKALPAPVRLTHQGRMPSEGSEQKLAALFAEVLGLREAVSADDDFFSLGGHSLLAARLASRIREAFALDGLSLGAVFEHSTVARLARHLDAMASQPGQVLQDSANDGGFGAVVKLREGDASLPALFCVHPAGGLSWCYGALARSLEPGRIVYGLQARSLHAASEANPWPGGLDAMAEDYADRLLELQPEGPYHLAGWSVGGIIAHAMAVELQRRGHAVGVLAMLDAYPSDCWRSQPEPAPDAVYKALLHIAGYDPLALNDVPLNRDGVVEFLRRSGHPLGELPDAQLDGVIGTVDANNRMVRKHRHGAFAGDVLYFRAALDHQGQNLFAHHWAPYVREIEEHAVASLHAHLTGLAALAQIMPVLNAHLLQADVAAEEV